MKRLCFLFLLLLLGCWSEQPLTERDHELLITIWEFDNITFDETLEAYEKVCYADGACSLEYAYDALGRADIDQIYLSSVVDIESSMIGANELFKINRVLVTLEGDASVDIVSFPNVADRTRFAYLRNDAGDIMGNAIVVMKNNYVFTVYLLGIYFPHDEPQFFMEFIQPRLDMIEDSTLTTFFNELENKS